MREVIFFAALLFSASASADQDCLVLYQRAQLARKAGKLMEARDALRVCASTACPKVTRDDCAPWLGEVEQALSSIVVSGRCGDHPQDGTATIDGHALEAAGAVESGPHTVELKTPYGSGSRSVDVAPGQKSQSIIVDLPPAACPPPPQQKHPQHSALLPIGLAVGGAGVVAFGFFAGFGAAGVSQRQDLIKRCYPHCSPSDVSGVRTLLNAADVSMVIGIVSVAIGGALLLWDLTHASSSQAAVRDPMTFVF